MAKVYQKAEYVRSKQEGIQMLAIANADAIVVDGEEMEGGIRKAAVRARRYETILKA